MGAESCSDTELRRMENNRWVRKSAQIQSYADVNDAMSFYEALRAVCGPTRFSLHSVRCIDGAPIKNKDMIHAT